MSATDPQLTRKRFPLSIFPLAVLAGAVTAVAGAAILGRAWNACDIGTNSANSVALLFLYIPLLGIAASAWWTGILVLFARREGSVAARALLALFIGTAGALVLIWALLAWRHNPGGDYPEPVCGTGNVPPWWPSWLPI